MRYHFLVASIFSILTFPIYGQNTAPEDVHNESLLEAQRYTAYTFMHALERNQIEKAFALIDSTFAKGKPSYIDSLGSFIKELSKYKDTTILSIVIVWPESKFNTYRCRYYNTNGEFFYMDLYLSTGRPFSLIQRIVKIPEAKLKKDRLDLAKYLKAHQNDTAEPVPPPQSPPPGVHKQR